MIEVKQFINISIAIILIILGLFDHILLTFAYRDFSIGLSVMFIFAPLTVALGYYLLSRELKLIITTKKGNSH